MIVTRRTALRTVATGAGLAAFAASAVTTRAQARGRTFVLVHGAWHGGWCWRYVAGLARRHLTADGPVSWIR